MTQAQIDWASAHIDWFDSPYSQFLAQYKAGTDAPMLVYDNYYCDYVGDAKWQALTAYASAHSITVDSMLVHYAVDTTVTFGSETHTLSAGSRVPTYGWYGTGGDLTQTGARVVTNPGSADFRAFNAQYQQTLTSTTYGGAAYDGVFVDNSEKGALTAAQGTIVSGGAFFEYPGSATVAAAAYDADIVTAFAAVRTAFGTKGAGNKQLAANMGVPTTAAPALYPYVDYVFWEFLISLSSDYRAGFDTKVSTVATAQASGVANVISAFGLGSTSTDQPDAKMMGLAEYYLMAGPLDYFCRQDLNSGDIQTYDWFGALEYNVGQPKAAAYTFNIAADPGSAKSDSGTGTVTHVGAVYTLTDTSKNWTPDNYWVGTLLVDSAGNMFAVYHSGSNWISFYRESSPYPASGAYSVGSFIAKVLARDYGNALVLARPKSDYNGPTGSGSAATYALPATSDNPSGTYYQLSADGTLGTAPLRQVALQAAQGVVFIKASSLVQSVPIASFLASPTAGSVPLQVQFTDTSTGAPTIWSWSFGDGGTSILQSPSHSFAAAGVYTISLTATNTMGSDTVTKSSYIAVGDALMLTKTRTPDGPELRPGDVITYTIAYSNAGQSTLTSAQIVDLVPTNTTYVNGSASNGAVYDGRCLTWNLSSLAPGASGTVTFSVTVN
jgi:uncharacterized repeat protein (TIGR01451 family)